MGIRSSRGLGYQVSAEESPGALIWAEPLTDNERWIISNIIENSDESDTVKQWLRFVIKTHDGVAEAYKRLRALSLENAEKNPVTFALARELGLRDD